MRTFIAFTLPDEVANQIAAWQQQNLPPNVYPEPVTNLHMTVAFIGDTPPENVGPLNAILAKYDPSTVTLTGAIEYREQDKLAFLVFQETGGTEIKEAVEADLAALTGYAPQFPGPWLAHTTLWRFSPENKPNLQPELPQLSFSPIALTLYQSVRNESGQGATYQHVSNILDPIQKALDPTVFRGTTPRDTTIAFINRLYKRAVQAELGLPPDIVDRYINLYVTGSLTTYQYSETSDCDVSVIPEYQALGRLLKLDPSSIRKELVALSIKHIDGTYLPGTTHPLQFFVVADGIKDTDLYQPGLRSAWSINESKWIVPPERERSHDIKTDFPDVYARAADMATKMKDALDHDPEAARTMWKQIHEKRQLDQRAGLGDFCEGNIVYKWLLHEGLFDRIRNELHEYIAAVEPQWKPEMPQEVTDRFLRMMVCPRCQSNLLQENGAVWCPYCGWEPKEAMAEQSGDPELDALLKRFEQSIYDRGLELHKEDQSVGWCEEMADEFAEFLNKHGILAENTSYRNETGEWDPLHPDAFGYQDRPIPGYYEGHAVTWIQKGEQEYIVDWTASQYGFEEFPMVQRLNDRQTWDRDWTSQVMSNEDSEPQHIIYDFLEDRIIIGVQSAEVSAQKMEGIYENGEVTLFEAEKQFLNAGYFKKLWHHSFPNKPLNGVHFQKGDRKTKLKHGGWYVD